MNIYVYVYINVVVFMIFLVLFLGVFEVFLIGVRVEINVKVVFFGGGKYRCIYILVVLGVYFFNIIWNGC